jgi:2-oxo-4-hydroxy-4-carboxy--5-ureidoimidazoline (OHCU) decarboxylase
VADDDRDIVDIRALDRLDPESFSRAVAPLFEGAPRFLGRLAAARPFGTEAALFERAREIAHSMPEAEQLELIDAHPRLGADPRSVSALSFREQGFDTETAGEAETAAGTTGTVGTAADTAAGTAAEKAARDRVARELDRLNAAYEARFGFRYCVFVAGRPRSAFIPEMTAALEADRVAEVRRALDAVVDIAADRYPRMSEVAS